MKRFFTALMFFVVAFAALIITGVINDQILLLFVGFSRMPPETAGETLRQAFDAWKKSDWVTFGKIGTPFLQGFLLLYVVKSLIYGISLAIVLFWTWPRVVGAMNALRLGGRLEESKAISEPADRESMIEALRNRAGQRRVEAYTPLGTALVCLVIAIGFVTRDMGDDRPESLDYSMTSIDNTLDKSESALSDVRTSFDARLDSYRQQQQQVLTLIESELEAVKMTKDLDVKKAYPILIQAILGQQAEGQSLQAQFEPEVVREYLAVAKSQVELVKQQAKIEVIQRTILVAVAKLAAVALVFALSQILLRMYQRAFDLAVQYDGIADALEILGDRAVDQLTGLREAITPVGLQDKAIKIPKTILEAIHSLTQKGELQAK